MRSISFVNDDPDAPVTAVGCPAALGKNGMRLAATFEAPMRWNSMPVLPYWLDSHTYGVRPENIPNPPRTCCSPLLFRSQLKPTRGEYRTPAGVSSVAKPKFATATGLAVGLSGNIGTSTRMPDVIVTFGRMRH